MGYECIEREALLAWGLAWAEGKGESFSGPWEMRQTVLGPRGVGVLPSAGEKSAGSKHLFVYTIDGFHILIQQGVPLSLTPHYG